MIPSLWPSGQSFKGLAQYLTHDPEAQTARRVAWTHTLNCANDNVVSVVNEMYATWQDADLLKAEAGVRPGGSKVGKAVKHFSLNWPKGERPSQDHMIETTRDFLQHRGWQEHQALLVAHDDKEHRHVHVMLNRIHPETGLALDDSFDWNRAQSWALEYEREHGKIYCEERLKPAAERKKSPTRDEWQALKQSEMEFARDEAQLRKYDPDYLERAENRKVTNSEEWKILKERLQSEREAFFANGKAEFSELRKGIYREIREEFREQWGDFYSAQRARHDPAALAEWRREIVEQQKAALDERRTEACAALRQDRDAEYRVLLDAQKDMRAELIDRQEQGLSSPHLLDLVNSRPSGPDGSPLAGAFRDADHEVTREVERPRTPAEEHDEDYGVSIGENGNLRPGLDVAGNLGLAVTGSFAAIGERLFDGFFGWSPTPEQDRREKPKAMPAPKPEFPRENPFAAAARQVRETATRQQERDDRDWWARRRERFRD